MARVKIKHPTPSPTKRTSPLRTPSQNLIYATKIIDVNDGYIMLIRNDEDIDKIFKGNYVRELSKEDFEPILPPEQSAKRTIIIFNVDSYIYGHTEKEVEELIRNNKWREGGVDKIYKFPKNNMIKISFKETTSAKRATEKGLLGIHMSIPYNNIKMEEYVAVNICMKCYKMEAHSSKQCPKDKEFKISFECGSQNHIWKDCKSNTKKCINCEGLHMTLANKCLERKKNQRPEIKGIKGDKKQT